MDSYVHRTRWLQRGQAVAMMNAYGEAMGGKGSAGNSNSNGAAPSTNSQTVKGNDLLAMMRKRTV